MVPHVPWPRALGPTSQARRNARERLNNYGRHQSELRGGSRRRGRAPPAAGAVPQLGARVAGRRAAVVRERLILPRARGRRASSRRATRIPWSSSTRRAASMITPSQWKKNRSSTTPTSASPSALGDSDAKRLRLGLRLLHLRERDEPGPDPPAARERRRKTGS